MKTATTERIVCLYSDASPIGTIEMTDRQHAQYLATADAFTGTIKLSDLVLCGEYVASETCDGDPVVYVEE